MSTLMTWYRLCEKGQQEVSRNHMKLCFEIQRSKCTQLYIYEYTYKYYIDICVELFSFLEEHLMHSLLHCCKLSYENSFKEGNLGTIQWALTVRTQVTI